MCAQWDCVSGDTVTQFSKGLGFRSLGSGLEAGSPDCHTQRRLQTKPVALCMQSNPHSWQICVRVERAQP